MNVSERARAAFMRCKCKSGPRKGQMLKNAPNRDKDPQAWAAWQGWETGFGRCNEGTIGGLMMLDPAVKDECREIWDEISDYVIAARAAYRNR